MPDQKTEMLQTVETPPFPDWKRIISTDAIGECMRGIDIFHAWRLGLAAWRKAQDLGVKFPHQREE